MHYKHFEQRFRHDATADFFFNARGDHLEKTALGLFSSLVHQLLKRIPSLFHQFLPKFRNKRELHGKTCDWHLRELQDFFSSIVARSEKKIFVFIDALDECDECQAQDLVEFLRCSISSGSALKICLSSRHYPHISIINCLKINVEHQNGPDIKTYVGAKLHPRNPDEQGLDLEKNIVQKASGVFMGCPCCSNDNQGES